MGYWRKMANRYGVKNFRSGGWNGNNLAIWNPAHPLNAFVGAGSTGNRERIENDFESYVAGAYKSNGPIFACMQARQMVFSEARFQYRRFQNGRPQELFGDASLDILEHPWPGGTTGELLVRMDQDASLAGNFFATVADDRGNLGKSATGEGRRIVRLRPDWVTILVGTKRDGIEGVNHADAQILAYVYRPQSPSVGLGNGAIDLAAEAILTPDEVCHYSPNPDPIARFRGMSWLTPIIREIRADSLALVHKENFFDNSAVPNMVVKFDKDTSEDSFDEFVEKFKAGHQGAWNAYKTLFLMGGADVTPLTHDFKQLDFSATVGKGESRIAIAAGVPSSWVGFSEGLNGSGLNSQGVFAAARRRFADGTIRPMWRMAASALQVLVEPPTGAELWFDERGIAFLREDAMDRAEIMRINLNAIDSGIKSGFEPDAVVEAIRDEDLDALIGHHTGLVSVQMQPPVDPDNENEQNQEEATIRQLQAQVVNVLTTSNFSIESIAEFMDTGDVAALELDPAKVAMQQAMLDHQNAQTEHTQAQAADTQADADNPRRDPNLPPPQPPGGTNSNVTNSGGTNKPKPKPASGNNARGGSNANS